MVAPPGIVQVEIICRDDDTAESTGQADRRGPDVARGAATPAVTGAESAIDIPGDRRLDPQAGFEAVWIAERAGR